MARTVVMLEKTPSVKVLTPTSVYFIRCTEVFEHVQKRDDDSKDVMHDKIVAEMEISGKTSRFLNTFLQGTPF